jgi:hypothetical protein
MFCELRELQRTRGTFFERKNVASVQQKVIYFKAATNLAYKTLGDQSYALQLVSKVRVLCT